MRGNRITTEAVFFHHKSATVIFTDLLQQFPPRWFSGWRALVARLDLMVGAEPRVPRKFRQASADRRAARTAVARILAWPAEKVLVAHGAPVTADGQAFLRRAFKWLGGGLAKRRIGSPNSDIAKFANLARWCDFGSILLEHQWRFDLPLSKAHIGKSMDCFLVDCCESQRLPPTADSTLNRFYALCQNLEMISIPFCSFWAM